MPLVLGVSDFLNHKVFKGTKNTRRKMSCTLESITERVKVTYLESPELIHSNSNFKRNFSAFYEVHIDKPFVFRLHFTAVKTIETVLYKFAGHS